MEGERTDSPGQSKSLSATRRRDRDRPEVFGVIGDTTRGEGERTDGAGVNYWGLNFRRKIVWLPECNTNTNTVAESPKWPLFSTLLTEAERAENRDFRGWVQCSMI